MGHGAWNKESEVRIQNSEEQQSKVISSQLLTTGYRLLDSLNLPCALSLESYARAN